MNIFAAEAHVQPCSTTSRAIRRRARGVSSALAWDTKGLLVVKRFLRQFHSTTGGLHLSDRLTVATMNNLPGHHN